MKELKKNDTIKKYMNKILLERVGWNRKVKRVLEMMTERYSRTKAEKMLDMIRCISEFKTDGNIEVLMDRFEDLVNEVD